MSARTERAPSLFQLFKRIEAAMKNHNNISSDFALKRFKISLSEWKQLETVIFSSKQSSESQKIEERVVTIKRQPGGGLGISVKGGAEHGIPVLISRVFPGQAAEETHLLHPGDAIVAINGKIVEHWQHDDVVNELRTCGQDVSLSVRAFDGANRILSPKNVAMSPQAQVVAKVESNNSKFEFQSSADASMNSSSHGFSSAVKKDQDLPCLDTSTQLNSSILQPSAKELAFPLLFSRLEGYRTGTDNERRDSFEVVTNDQTSSGLITCSSPAERAEWFSAVSEAIHKASERHMPQLTKQLSCDDIIQMGWVNERTSANPEWKHSFLILSTKDLRFFNLPPTSIADWSGCNRVYVLYESLRRVHSPPRPLLDNRKHCFSIQHGTQLPIYCNVPTKADLTRWTDKMERATYDAVDREKVKRYPCTSDGRRCEFTVHFIDGFQLTDSTSEEVLWAYKFSQLRSSSDDGSELITFTFHNRVTNQVDRQSFTCERAYPLLFCVHSFLAAKLAQVDPALLEKVNAHAQLDKSAHQDAVVNGVPETN